MHDWYQLLELFWYRYWLILFPRHSLTARFATLNHHYFLSIELHFLLVTIATNLSADMFRRNQVLYYFVYRFGIYFSVELLFVIPYHILYSVVDIHYPFSFALVRHDVTFSAITYA